MITTGTRYCMIALPSLHHRSGVAVRCIKARLRNLISNDQALYPLARGGRVHLSRRTLSADARAIVAEWPADLHAVESMAKTCTNTQ